MPPTNRDLYPGSAFDLTFGGAGFPWTANPSPAEVNDAENVQPDPTFGLFSVSSVVPRTAYAEYRLDFPPSGIVSIASLQVIAWVMARSTGGTFDTDVSAMYRPAGAGEGSASEEYTAPTVLTSHTADARVYEEIAFPAWTVNPVTSAPWVVTDIAAGAFGIRFAAPDAIVSNPSIELGRFRVVMLATVLAADTSAVRVVGSSVLRFLSRSWDRLRFTGPADLADIGIGECFFIEHPRGPRPGGPGWGRKTWERGWFICESKSVDPMGGPVEIVARDMRRPATRYWLPGLTTVGHSLDGQGLPLLHSGGGAPAVTRAGVKYVERPISPPDSVLVAMTENLLAHGWQGMAIESGDDTNSVLNSSFSQGAGSAFDNWSNNVSGSGTVTEETGRVGVDEIGLRRAAHLMVNGTDASVAQITQDITVSQDFRCAIRSFNNFGINLSAVLQRASDSKYWNDSGGTWDVAIVFNRIGDDVDGGPREWVSKLVSSGADTITLSIGYFGEASTTNYQAFIWQVDLIEGRDHVGTPIVTTTAPVARIADFVEIPNNIIGRWWGFERGFSWALGFIPLFNAGDLTAGTIKCLLHVDHNDGGYSQILYQKALDAIEDRWVFSIHYGGTDHICQFVVTGRSDLEPLRGRLIKLSGYYIGEEGELDRAAGTINLALNDEWGPAPVVLPGVPTMDDVSTGYLGQAFSGGGDEGTPSAWCDGYLRQLDVSPVVLRDEELERKPS